MLRVILLSTCLVGMSGMASAQEAPFPGQEAQDQMYRLASLEGDWTAEISLWGQDGDWQVHGEETVHIYYMLNHMALREDPAEHPVNTFRLESTIQYDQNRDEYRLVAMDDTWGNMDIYSGDWTSEDTLTLDNLTSGTSYVGPDGSQMHFRLSTQIIDADHNIFTVEMSGDGGASWLPFQRIERRRLEAAD